MVLSEIGHFLYNDPTGRTSLRFDSGYCKPKSVMFYFSRSYNDLLESNSYISCKSLINKDVIA